MLPIKDGIPSPNAFILKTYEDIDRVYKSTTVVSYAHCIVAQPVSSDTPSFLRYVLGTDSKYTHKDIQIRWEYIKQQLKKREVVVLSSGADGAGPFFKAMMNETKLFKKSVSSNVPSSWTFFAMPKLLSACLFAQDTVHLLAKLRTKLITPSNIISLGSEFACRGHLTEVLKLFPKARHGLTERAVDNRDKAELLEHRVTC